MRHSRIVMMYNTFNGLHSVVTWQYEICTGQAFLLPFMATQPTRIVRISPHQYERDEFLEGIYINKNQMLAEPVPLPALYFGFDDFSEWETCEVGNSIILEIRRGEISS